MKKSRLLLSSLLFVLTCMLFNCTNSKTEKEKRVDEVKTETASESSPMRMSAVLPQSSTGFYEVLQNGDTIFFIPRDSTVTKTVTSSFTFTVWDTVKKTKGVVTLPDNKLPIADAGPGKTITLPINSVVLNGIGSDPDGVISGYQWNVLSGNGVSLTTPLLANTSAINFNAGVYVIRLTVTDNSGATGWDTVTVNVLPAPTPGYILTFSTGYDKTSDMLFEGNGQYGNGTISTTKYFTGPGSFYSRPANVSSGIRSEVQYGGSAQNNEEGAIEYDVMYEVVIPNNGHSLQFHPGTGGGSASPGLMHEGGKFSMENWKGGAITWYRTGITIQTNKWYHIRMEYKFGSAGYFRLYIDGVLATSWTGQVGDNSGHYLKVGYNGWDASSMNSRIYYDNLKVYKKG